MYNAEAEKKSCYNKSKWFCFAKLISIPNVFFYIKKLKKEKQKIIYAFNLVVKEDFKDTKTFLLFIKNKQKSIRRF
jgi:hypothetical protein